MRIYTIPIIILIFNFLLSGNSLLAQEQIGLRIENYSGVNSLLLNPANNLSSPFKWDVNLVAAGFFGESNYGYFRETNLSGVVNGLENIQRAVDFENQSQYPEDALILEYFDNEREKFGIISSILSGPGLMLNMWENFSFGFFTNLRAVSSAPHIPGVLNYYTFDETPFYENMRVAPFSMAAMLWSEFGLNAAASISTYSGSFGFGINVKILNGYEGFYFKNLQQTDIAQAPGDTILYADANVEFGLTTTNTVTGSFDRIRNGGGISIDLGMMYQLERDEDSYIWKLGFSLLDFGKISFRNNAEVHRINTDLNGLIATREYRGYDDLQDYVRLLSQQTLGASDASYEKEGFDIWLPSAISLQADYSFTPNVYVNALLIQSIAFGNARIERGNLLAISPRFESRWFGGALPLGLYNWRDFRIGASIRLGYLTIGSDNIGSIIGTSDFTGSDLYIALKFNPFQLNLSKNGWGSKVGKNVKCYEF